MTTKPKWTEGPWHINTLEVVPHTIHANRGWVAEVSTGTMCEVGADEIEANTRLISKAPEMAGLLGKIAGDLMYLDLRFDDLRFAGVNAVKAEIEKLLKEIGGES